MSDNDEEFPKNSTIPRAISGMIFEELLQHERFGLFLQANYDISLFKNDEDKKIEVKVTEIPYQEAQEALTVQLKDKVAKRRKKGIVLAKEGDLAKLPKHKLS